tara:strand:+ start:330 stop:527 length:198 start_codon:yes stop_codon:yes gene_type:complete
MGEKTTKYPFVSEGEMMFGKKVRAKSSDFLNFKNFLTKKGDKYDTTLEADVFNPYIGVKFTKKKK